AHSIGPGRSPRRPRLSFKEIGRRMEACAETSCRVCLSSSMSNRGMSSWRKRRAARTVFVALFFGGLTAGPPLYRFDGPSCDEPISAEQVVGAPGYQQQQQSGHEESNTPGIRFDSLQFRCGLFNCFGGLLCNLRAVLQKRKVVRNRMIEGLG